MNEMGPGREFLGWGPSIEEWRNNHQLEHYIHAKRLDFTNLDMVGAVCLCGLAFWGRDREEADEKWADHAARPLVK